MADVPRVVRVPQFENPWPIQMTEFHSESVSYTNLQFYPRGMRLRVTSARSKLDDRDRCSDKTVGRTPIMLFTTAISTDDQF